MMIMFQFALLFCIWVIVIARFTDASLVVGIISFCTIILGAGGWMLIEKLLDVPNE